MMEIYHVLSLTIEKIDNFDKASKTMNAVTATHKSIKNHLTFPNTEFPGKKFDGIEPQNLIKFVENVPGSSLIDFHGKKLSGSMDFIHLMVASNLKCKKFFTEDKGVLKLDKYNHKGNMKIIKPSKP